MTNKIEYKYNHWHLPDDLRALLMECMLHDPSQQRYKGVYAGENVLVTTDGRRLIEITIEHSIESGFWFCTQDGWLLNTLFETFPQYAKIIPKKKDLRRLVRIPGCEKRAVSIVLGALAQAGCIVDIDLLYKPMALLWDLDMQDVDVFVHKKKASTSFFMLTGITHYGPIRYLQMHIPLAYETE